MITKPRVLTDPLIRSLKPAPAGKRYAVADALVPSLKVRVTDRGTKSFVLWRRFGGAANPAARSLGEVGTLSLAAARDKARNWIEQIKKGEDPREAERARHEADDIKKGSTFGAVIEDYLARHVKGKRKARDVEREIRKELIPPWRHRSVSSITRRDVTILIDTITDRGAVYQAHNILGHVKTFFNWAIERGIYGLETSPADRIKPARLIGPKAPRQRVLSDLEIAALWRAAKRIGYPNGPLFQMLLLTGQRKSEVAEARWREFNLDNRTWTIPPERFKSDATHVVPLSGEVMTLLESLPRWVGGDFLFSTTGGRTPVNGFSKAKVELDRRMALSLRAVARLRGESAELPDFVLHDLRRTMRTRLSSLRVPDAVSEMIIGHGRKGLQRIYDQHTYLEEMREALEAWALRARSIAEPPAPNVIQFKGDAS